MDTPIMKANVSHNIVFKISFKVGSDTFLSAVNLKPYPSATADLFYIF